MSNKRRKRIGRGDGHGGCSGGDGHRGGAAGGVDARGSGVVVMMVVVAVVYEQLKSNETKTKKSKQNKPLKSNLTKTKKQKQTHDQLRGI